jgi:CHAD domain-containing protein
VQARIQAHVARAAAASHSAVTAALGSKRYYALLDALEALIASPKTGPEAGRSASGILPAAVRRSYVRTRRRMRAALTKPAGPARDDALHAARKAAKRARYAAEAAVPVSEKAARRFAGQMKKVQSVLGDHQDAVNARALARDLGVEANLAGESAFSFGTLYDLIDHEAHEHQHKARRAWKRASDPRVR